MTVKTAKAPSAGQTLKPSDVYEQLLVQVRELTGRDATTRLELASLLNKMIKNGKTVEEIAADTDITAAAVKRMAAVAAFWGTVRITPNGNRTAPWFLYDRIAMDPLIKDARRALIKKAASNGLAVVRELVNDARNDTLDEVNAIARATRQQTSTRSKPTPPRPAAAGRPVQASVEVDGSVFVIGALRSLDSAVSSLDKLESLSEEDAGVIRNRVNDVVAQIVRLTGVPK